MLTRISGFDLVPDYKEEQFFASGAYTVGMPANVQHCLPFEVFPEKGIEHIEFKKITCFAGGASSVRELLVKIIASKLVGLTVPEGMHPRCFMPYINMCYVRCEGERPNSVYISEAQARSFVQEKYARLDKNKSWTMLDFFDKRIPTDSFVIIEEPEKYMSLYEQLEFAEYLKMSVKDSQNQFVLSTNSPIFLGIRNALIYDCDVSPIVGTMWSYSPLMSEYEEKYSAIIETHKKNKNNNSELEVHNDL